MTKIKKIRYSMNLMLQTGMFIQNSKDGKSIETINPSVSLMQLCSDTEELEIFETECMQNIIEFKWTMYGRKHHYLGMAMHMFYTLMITIYVHEAYMNQPMHQQLYTVLLAVGILYPAFYDFKQLYIIGIRNYFSDIGNYSDCLYIWGSLVNVFL